MATFWDLPRPVRDKIYRLHLVQEEPITKNQHREYVKYKALSHKRFMPPVCYLSKKAEMEAAPIYYGENHFDIGIIQHVRFEPNVLENTWPRHVNRITKLTCEWSSTSGGGSYMYSTKPRYGGYGLVRENFMRLARLKGLKELNIRVHEAEMLKSLTNSRETRQSSTNQDFTPQQHLAILRLDGITGFLELSTIKYVNFIKTINEDGKETGGPILGGPLETIILPRLRAARIKRKRVKKGSFPFLSLPPELRNRVYDELLRIPGRIHPSMEPPTSAPKDDSTIKLNESRHHESALSVLLVNKQIHDEAIGIFYNANEFIFYYPTQLHAFVLSLSPKRQQLIQSITLHYYNIKCGGVELIDLTMPLLKQLRSLRKLHIIMLARPFETNLRRGWYQQGRWSSTRSTAGCNPARIPGMKHLFELRGITDIKIVDVELQNKVEELKEKNESPKFAEDPAKKCIVRLLHAYEHFNTALADAQHGKINSKLLEDNDWQLWDEFPTMEDVD